MRFVAWVGMAALLGGCTGDIVQSITGTGSGGELTSSGQPPHTTSMPPTTAGPSPTTSPHSTSDSSGLDTGGVSTSGPPPFTTGPDTWGTTGYETDTWGEGTTTGDITTGGVTTGGVTTDGGTTGVTTAGMTTTGVTTTDPTTGGPFGCVEVDLGSMEGTAVATGSTLGEDDDLSQSCAGMNGPDVVHEWTAPYAATWVFDTNGSNYDTALTLYNDCGDASDFACNDDGGMGLASLIEYDLEAGQTILIVVEGFANSVGSYQLNINGIAGGTTGTTGGTGGMTGTGTTGMGGTTGTGSTGGDPLDAFETPQPFGDDVQETDLVGTWNLPTDGSNPGYSMTLTIDSMGNFDWQERDGTCALVREGTGVLWVAGVQMVMLWETFDPGPAPWPVSTQFGFDADAPFLLRVGYAPVLGHIAMSAPDDLRIALPWASRGYARTIGGTTAIDTWVSETELWDVVPGDSVATIISRDRHTLDIPAGGTATHTFRRYWYSGGVQTADPPVITTPSYSDDGVGHLDLAGDPYVYVGNRMASYAVGDNFQKNAPTACP